MSHLTSLIWVLLSVSILGFNCGCATLPDVAEKLDAAPNDREPRQIATATGTLSPKQSRAILERLKRSVTPTDVL
jgi:cardiolipin synthase